MTADKIKIDFSCPVVMTILNVTPDSFFAGSRMAVLDNIRIEEAIERAKSEGAGIIDVGGYSSRPGAGDVAPQEEWRRVARGIAAVRKVAPGMTVSVDTFRSYVARKSLEEFGSCIINDISGGELDPHIMDVVAEYGVPYIVVHMRGTPADIQRHTQYGDIVTDVAAFFEAKIKQLRVRGIEDIILDPGFGFAKDTRQNYDLLAGMDRLLGFGYPVLVGLSRKSMIYKVLDSTPADALPGTVALNWEALRKGASILRVHDTKEASDVIKLYNYYNQKS